MWKFIKYSFNKAFEKDLLYLIIFFLFLSFIGVAFTPADLFLDPRGGLSTIGQKELLSLNQLDDSGKLTDKADLERKTLFKNPQAAPLELSADDLIGAIMDPRPVKR